MAGLVPAIHASVSSDLSGKAEAAGYPFSEFVSIRPVIEHFHGAWERMSAWMAVTSTAMTRRKEDAS